MQDWNVVAKNIILATQDEFERLVNVDHRCQGLDVLLLELGTSPPHNLGLWYYYQNQLLILFLVYCVCYTIVPSLLTIYHWQGLASTKIEKHVTPLRAHVRWAQS